MRYTVAWSCPCGGNMAIDGRSHRMKWQSLVYVFTEMHKHCVKESSDDSNEESGGDVFTHVTLAQDHSEPELVTGFQRQLW